MEYLALLLDTAAQTLRQQSLLPVPPPPGQPSVFGPIMPIPGPPQLAMPVPPPPPQLAMWGMLPPQGFGTCAPAPPPQGVGTPAPAPPPQYVPGGMPFAPWGMPPSLGQVHLGPDGYPVGFCKASPEAQPFPPPGPWPQHPPGLYPEPTVPPAGVGAAAAGVWVDGGATPKDTRVPLTPPQPLPQGPRPPQGPPPQRERSQRPAAAAAAAAAAAPAAAAAAPATPGKKEAAAAEAVKTRAQRARLGSVEWETAAAAHPAKRSRPAAARPAAARPAAAASEEVVQVDDEPTPSAVARRRAPDVAGPISPLCAAARPRHLTIAAVPMMGWDKRITLYTVTLLLLVTRFRRHVLSSLVSAPSCVVEK